MKKQGLNERNR